MNKPEKPKIEELEQLCKKMQKCWSHHLDGSDLVEESDLFSMVFNDFPRILRYRDSIYFKLKDKDKRAKE